MRRSSTTARMILRTSRRIWRRKISGWLSAGGGGALPATRRTMTMVRRLKILLAIAAVLAASAALAEEIPLSNVFYTGAPWNQDQPQAASDGKKFLIAWRDNRAHSGFETIYAARVAPDGHLLDPPTAIRIPDPRDAQPKAW